MNLHNYQKASDYDIQKWIEKAVVGITPYQMQKLRDNEAIRFAPFEFMEQRKKINNIWLRLTVIFIPFVWVILAVGLPFNFFITGRWGYKYEIIKWFDKWRSNVGI